MIKILPAEERYIEQMMVLEQACFGADAWAEESMRYEMLADHTRYFVLLEGETSRAGLRPQAFGKTSQRSASPSSFRSIFGSESR